MSDVEREANRMATKALNRWMAQFFYDVSPEQEMPGDTKMNRNRRSYHYWESPDQRMFCYTPWKDRNGDYWTWVMKPYGKGSKSGKSRQWKQVGKRVRSRKRKTARKRAQTRYTKWMWYLTKNELRKPLED